jgi:proteic killer suppression protein
MIVSFACKRTEELFRTQRSRHFGTITRVALRKLFMLAAAIRLLDLAVPRGNHLEPLHGDREGFHSIKINDQFRIVFRWTQNGPADIAIVDYH